MGCICNPCDVVELAHVVEKQRARIVELERGLREAGRSLEAGEAALLKACIEGAGLEAEVSALRHVGGQLANCAYNLWQPSVSLTDRTRQIFGELQREWDAIPRAKRTP